MRLGAIVISARGGVLKTPPLWVIGLSDVVLVKLFQVNSLSEVVPVKYLKRRSLSKVE